MDAHARTLRALAFYDRAWPALQAAGIALLLALILAVLGVVLFGLMGLTMRVPGTWIGGTQGMVPVLLGLFIAVAVALGLVQWRHRRLFVRARCAEGLSRDEAAALWDARYEGTDE
ncbi:hypothetical protein [Futiania mangrovi]|uniref:Cytochrome c biogenesis protein ResB n=1 Tax=Futiania mangrovi TaxID=2959716 RepID=A0A9J6PHY8_9PROT|nr:hypothetical protein [Futiania mangrovii]MCP1335698.1 cytochrome c biogenesis protein ResB [Futiania mangrovii]